MPGLSDVRLTETLCPTIPWGSHQGGALLHAPGRSAAGSEEACDHGLQNGSQVGFSRGHRCTPDQS